MIAVHCPKRSYSYSVIPSFGAFIRLIFFCLSYSTSVVAPKASVKECNSPFSYLKAVVAPKGVLRSVRLPTSS